MATDEKTLLKIKKCHMILTEKLQKYHHYRQVN